MAGLLTSARRRLGRFVRREAGSATIEFALIFPALMTFFLMSIETGVLLVRGVMLDRGMDVAMREVRLGSLSPMTHDGLKQAVCRNAVIIPDCMNAVLIEMRPIDTSTWATMDNRATCVDRSAEIQPAVEFRSGAKHEMMLVRACAVFDPFFPAGVLAASMPLDRTGAYGMLSTSAFVNEP